MVSLINSLGVRRAGRALGYNLRHTAATVSSDGACTRRSWARCSGTAAPRWRSTSTATSSRRCMLLGAPRV